MSPRSRWRFAPLFVVVLLACLAVMPGSARAAARCFPETGQCIDGRIREFWEQNGGLPVFGFPVAPQREEQVEGRPVQVQWFERNRLELHPENPRPYDVLLGRLGADRLAQQGRDWFAFPKAQPQDGCRFFAETGHNVCGSILRAWRASGLEIDGRAGKSEAESLALFGMPLSEPQQEDTPSGSFMVQWFERARFELHPEHAPPSDVLLGLLGNEILAGGSGTPAPAPVDEQPAPPTGSAPTIANPTIEWGRASTITSRRLRAFYPWVVVDSNNYTHIIFANDEDNLVYTNNIAGSFAPPQMIEPNIGANREPFYALALGPGNTLHVAYALLGGDRQLYYRLATLSGTTANWTERQRISDGPRPFAAHLAVDSSGAAHIVWIDQNCGTYNVYYRVRYPDLHLSDISAPAGDCLYQNRPQVALASDGRAHIIFQHERDIFYARRDPGGWVVENISNSPKTPSYNPTIASDGTAVYAAWDEGDNNHDVVFRSSANGGASWSEISGLSDSETFATFPNLTYAPSSRRVYAVWSDVKNFNRNDPYIMFAAYDPATGSRTKPQRLVAQKGTAIHPVIAAGPSAVSVVWQYHSQSTWQIYHIGGEIVSKE